MKPSVYIETTIPSYLTAWPSRDIFRLAHQQATREWWERRDEFELFVSEFVIEECREGDPGAAAERLESLDSIPVLATSDEANGLARHLMREMQLPPKARIDAFHIAVAAMNGVDYLLTWNCTHIANAMLRSVIESVCRDHDVDPPIICTPLELKTGGTNEPG